MKRIRNVEVCIEGAVTRHGTVIGPAMTSLVGYSELTPTRAVGAAMTSGARRCRPTRRTPRAKWCGNWVRPEPRGLPGLLRGGPFA